MKVWVDAYTPKQILLFSYLQWALNEHEIFLTTRDYDLNAKLAQTLWKKFFVVGRYGGQTPVSKLRESIARQKALLDIVSSEGPDLHVTFVSPDSTRIAFGLGIPVVTSSDSPHSDIVSRLSIPLSRVFVTPSFLMKNFEKYQGITHVVGFNGVFELAWVLREKPDEKIPLKLGLEPFNYVLVRPGEQKAYYYPDPRYALSQPLSITRLVLERTNLDVLIYPRYPEQLRVYRKALSRWHDRVKVLEEATSFVSLEFFARLVVTGGGTMATESALLGTPSVSTYPGEIEVHSFIRRMGFPLFRTPVSQKLLLRLLSHEPTKEERRRHIEKARRSLEDPISIYKSIVLFGEWTRTR
ncbi:MAG: DUF354 domain-containing protein [Infirmifilum sp.]